MSKSMTLKKNISYKGSALGTRDVILPTHTSAGFLLEKKKIADRKRKWNLKNREKIKKQKAEK